MINEEKFVVGNCFHANGKKLRRASFGSFGNIHTYAMQAVSTRIKLFCGTTKLLEEFDCGNKLLRSTFHLYFVV